MLREPEVARDRVIHRGEKAVGAAHEVPPADIRLQESGRELDEYAPGRDAHAARSEVCRLLVRVSVELRHLIAERADGKVVHDSAQPPHPGARLEPDS